MVAQNKPRRAIYADVESLPENMVGEIISGELYTQPRPAAPHASAHSILLGELSGPFRLGRGGPGGWIILTEPELHFGDISDRDVLVPDMAGWRRERMAEVPNVVGIELAPDWVCEVLSPSTAKKDRVKKMPIYAREQVRHVWLIDPLQQTLEVFRFDGGHFKLVAAYAENQNVRAEPFEAVELDLGLLWQK